MPISVAVLGAIAAAIVILVWKMATAWVKYRGDLLITCPENRRPAGVRVDAGHAAATSLAHRPEMRLASCSRWPERAGCGQECLSQLETAPENCLVRNILVTWFAGKLCAVCGRPVGGIHEIGGQPALRRTDKVTVELKQIPVDQLPDTLAACEPVCFACHMADVLVREHPELAIDRSRPLNVVGRH